jgi:hypothetical protein
MKKYPNTELATQARDRLAQIGGEPDEPPKRLAWIVDLFPQSSEKSRVARIPELQNGGTRLAEGENNSNNGQAVPQTTTR